MTWHYEQYETIQKKVLQNCSAFFKNICRKIKIDEKNVFQYIFPLVVDFTPTCICTSYQASIHRATSVLK